MPHATLYMYYTAGYCPLFLTRLGVTQWFDFWFLLLYGVGEILYIIHRLRLWKAGLLLNNDRKYTAV